MGDYQRNSWASSMAGFIGQSSTILLFPLEALKIHLMVSDGFSANHIPKYKNSLQALKFIYNKSGIFGLYQGCYTTFFASIA
jgi:hypothetical protein